LPRSDYRRFARPTYRHPSVRLSHDADCRNAIKRSSISQLGRSLALNGLQFRKDIELLRCDFHSAASHSEAQRLCPPFSEMQSSRIVPLASAPAFARLRRAKPDSLRGAAFHNARSLRCAQKSFAKHLQSGAEYLAALLPGLRHSETVPALFSRTDSESFCWRCDHLRRSSLCFRPFRSRTPTCKAGRPAAGAQVITEWLNANPIYSTRESLLDCMARCVP